MRFLLLNQTFWPDVAATGQYLTKVALALASRGHEVTVVTSRRAYDHPDQLFPKNETWRGIRILRIGSTGFGKGAKWRRAADFASFYALCALRLAFQPRPDAIVALTTPPLISFLGACVARLRRARFFYWVMDFNPDEAIAAGWLQPGSFAARTLEALSRFSLRHATRIFALDHFMRDRIAAKGIHPDRIAVLPPWSHDGDVAFDASGRDRFRQAHGLADKFVVMYSGNHSPVHPLDTALAAAERLRDDKDLVFLFVGGGSEWRKMNEKQKAERRKQESAPLSPAVSTEEDSPLPSLPSVNPPSGRYYDRNDGRGELPTVPVSVANRKSEIVIRKSNIRCLPYQPLSELSASLSAADLHLVVMGNPFVGLVHPCKIYNILTVGAPVLYVGPAPSHLSEILQALPADYPALSANHGDVAQVIHAIRTVRNSPRPSRHLPQTVLSQFSKQTILPQLIAELEADV